MKVSIIIPIYKVEPWLRQCLDSVLAQTFSDYECILVDDGRPDGCGAICDEYARGDRRFRVIHKENGGLSDARNAGLDAASGEYVYFLDSDDRVEPELLEQVVPELEKGAELVVFGYRRLPESGIPEPGRQYESREIRLDSQKKRLDFFCGELIPGKLGWEAWSRIFVREKIEQYGLRFADNRKIFAEDLYFSLCYCAHAETIRCMEGCFYQYRIRENSIMGVQQTRSNLGRIGRLAEAVLTYYRRFDDCQVLAENFDSLYYYLMAGQFTYQMWASQLPPAEYRELVREEITDWGAMEDRLRNHLRKKGRLGGARERELRANVLFLLGGSEFALRLRCRLLRGGKENRGK